MMARINRLNRWRRKEGGQVKAYGRDLLGLPWLSQELQRAIRFSLVAALRWSLAVEEGPPTRHPSSGVDIVVFKQLEALSKSRLSEKVAAPITWAHFAYFMHAAPLLGSDDESQIVHFRCCQRGPSMYVQSSSGPTDITK